MKRGVKGSRWCHILCVGIDSNLYTCRKPPRGPKSRLGFKTIEISMDGRGFVFNDLQSMSDKIYYVNLISFYILFITKYLADSSIETLQVPCHRESQYPKIHNHRTAMQPLSSVTWEETHKYTRSLRHAVYNFMKPTSPLVSIFFDCNALRYIKE